MKPSFKYVINIIIVSLVVILIFQFYWLSKLYNSIEDQVTSEVIQSIAASDDSELFIRMNKLKKESPDKKNNITVSKTIDTDEEQSNDSTEETQIHTLLNFDSFIKSLSSSVHQYVDSIYPINLVDFDSIMNIKLQEKNIQAQLCYTQVLDLKNNRILQTSASQQEIAQFANTKQYIHEFNENEQYVYAVYLTPLTYTILIRMLGILISTLLIIILLSFAFYYLIKTVLRQKTLEEMKDDFINSMTHELKTPIAVAYSVTDTLLNFKQGDDKEKRNKYLTICKDQLSGLSGLVEQILSMSMERREGFILNKKEIDITDLIRNLTEHHRLKSNKEINFTTDINPEDLIIYADPIHFNNIISNLIDNAIKYSDNKVDIDIKITKVDKDYIITITDNGMGIPSEKQPYIFDKFYRVSDGNKYQIKGYGLGLFYVKTMVEKHNGTISVSSNKNKGTTFTITIPIEKHD